MTATATSQAIEWNLGVPWFRAAQGRRAYSCLAVGNILLNTRLQ